MENILLVEDCEEVRILAGNALKSHKLYTVSSLKAAKEVVSEVHFSLFIIDIDLPDGSGFDFCQELSNIPKFESIPKIFLSGHQEVSQKVFGFSCGADDYITKPFVQQEFLARVEARLRKKGAAKVEHIGKFSFDHGFQRCMLAGENGGQDLGLTPTEFRLLHSLVKNTNTPLSRRELVKSVWNANGLNIESRGIDSHISHLRKKMKGEGDTLISVYGKGYAFKINDLDSQATA